VNGNEKADEQKFVPALAWGNKRVGAWSVYDVVRNGEDLRVVPVGDPSATDRYFVGAFGAALLDNPASTEPGIPLPPIRHGPVYWRQASDQRSCGLISKSSHSADPTTLASQFSAAVAADVRLSAEFLISIPLPPPL